MSLFLVSECFCIRQWRVQVCCGQRAGGDLRLCPAQGQHGCLGWAGSFNKDILSSFVSDFLMMNNWTIFLCEHFYLSKTEIYFLLLLWRVHFLSFLISWLLSRFSQRKTTRIVIFNKSYYELALCCRTIWMVELKILNFQNFKSILSS